MANLSRLGNLYVAMGVTRDAIVQALAWLGAEHGGAAGYLRSAGFGDDDLEALRTALTA